MCDHKQAGEHLAYQSYIKTLKDTWILKSNYSHSSFNAFGAF